MEDKSKKLKIRFYIIFISFGVLVAVLSLVIAFGAYKELFQIKRSNWLNMLFAWISSASAIFLGLIAYWQNERFKLENDLSTQRAETKSDEYQAQLLSINNRLIKLEESKEYTYIAFTQDPVFVGNSNISFKTSGKTYTAGITNNGKEFYDSSVLVFSITNQTEVPIRCFQILKLKIQYSDYGDKKTNKEIVTYDTGGFVPSPIIKRGEIVKYVLVANGLKNLAENLPDGMEISLVMTLEVISIYDKTVNQEFLIRLQRKNSFFNAKNDKNIFWNYCYESTPKRIE